MVNILNDKDMSPSPNVSPANVGLSILNETIFIENNDTTTRLLHPEENDTCHSQIYVNENP